MPKPQGRVRHGLRDSAFFRCRARKKLAELLQTSPSTLREVALSDRLYKRCWKHKKEEKKWLRTEPMGDEAEKYRPIDIPDPRLKAMQKRIGDLLGRIEPPDYLFSPVKGRSYVDNAGVHLGSDAFWTLDIEDYFPSCSANNIARFFQREMECSPDVTAILVELTTLHGGLPQGSPCSPILAYFSNRAMWDEVNSLVKRSGCLLSVYADDISISGPIVPKAMVWQVKKVIHRNGLRLKKSKEVSLIHRPASITGVVVRPDGMKLPNRKQRALAELKSERKVEQNPDERERLDRKIAGRLSQKKQVESWQGKDS